jgi:folate-dependent phosphoribosylglycinamide formyltransferase PurN
MANKKIIMLATKGLPTNIIYNVLDKCFGVDQVIIEEKESAKIFLKRRFKKLGWFTAIGQILFQFIVVKLLIQFSRKRTKEIIKLNNLNTKEIPAKKIRSVHSVNDESTLEIIKEINPDLIIVCGTRIISKKLLGTIACRLINIHAGITPLYRGVHGTYWALVNNDIENSGVTVHFIDEGIDTGNIIVQGHVGIGGNDNFTTYPLLQLARGVELLVQSVADYFDNTISIKKVAGKSKLFYHPTIWEYLYYRVIRKVK